MNLFAYGTLMWPEIMSEVIGRQIAGRPAQLDGVLRLCVRNEVYPALVPAEDGSSSDGILYEDLSASEMTALDRFEGVEYERRAVPVRANGEVVSAQVYFASGTLSLTDALWHPEQVVDEDLNRFRREYKGWF